MLRAAGVFAALLAAPLLPRPAVAQAAPQAPAPLFQGDSVLAVTIRTDVRALFGDRDSTRALWREATLTLAGAGPGGADLTVPLRLRTRGIYRLAHCAIPPVRLRFAEREVRGTPFDALGRPKLVSPCQDDRLDEQYLLHEYALYRVYQLFTPIAFRARLLRVTWQDAARRARPVTRWAFVTEDPERLARRLGGALDAETSISLGRLDRTGTLTMSLFQYLIANTDWSVPSLHNIALVRTDTLYAVPFDFDWAGVINARYAVPSKVLHILTVRDRQYRGLCQPADKLAPVLARFEALRDSIAAVYHAVPGLEAREVAQALRYFDAFYREAADPARFERRVVAPDCMW
jgi:hypothetical protein